MNESLSTETSGDVISRLESIQSRLITLLTHCRDTETSLCFYQALEPISLTLSQLSQTANDVPPAASRDTRLCDLERLLSHAESLSPSANGVWHAHLGRVASHIAKGWYTSRTTSPINTPHDFVESVNQQPQPEPADSRPTAAASLGTNIPPSGGFEPDASSTVEIEITKGQASSSDPALERPADPQSISTDQTDTVKQNEFLHHVEPQTPGDPFAESVANTKQPVKESPGQTEDARRRDCRTAAQLEKELWNEWEYMESHDMQAVEFDLRMKAVGFGLLQRKALLARAHHPELISSDLYEQYVNRTRQLYLPELPAIPHGVDAEYARRAAVLLCSHIDQFLKVITGFDECLIDHATMKKLVTEVQVLINAIVPLDAPIAPATLSEWIAEWEGISTLVKAPAMHREIRSQDVREAETKLPNLINNALTASEHAAVVSKALDAVASAAIDVEYHAQGAVDTLIQALIQCKALNVPSTNRELRNILAHCVSSLSNPKVDPEWCEGLNMSEKQVRTYVCDIMKAIQEDEKRNNNGHRRMGNESEYEAKAQALCEGKTLLIISFHRNHERPEQLRQRLGFAEVHWPDLDSHDNSTDIRQLVAGHDLVLLDVRGCRTHWSKDIPDYCEQEGITCLRLPRGVGIGHISQQIVEHSLNQSTALDETAEQSVTI